MARDRAYLIYAIERTLIADIAKLDLPYTDRKVQEQQVALGCPTPHMMCPATAMQMPGSLNRRETSWQEPPGIRHHCAMPMW